MSFCCSLPILLPVLLVASSTLFAADMKNDCTDRSGAASADACRQIAEQLSADKQRLYDLASSLEAAGRHAGATAVYEVASHFYPRDRRLMQGLIRARSNSRSMSLLTTDPNGHDKPDTPSPCWTLQWTDALSACETERRESPGDARLQERTGDVLRNVGNVDQALAAYDEALRLSPSNDDLVRKRRSLALLVGRTPGHSDKLTPVGNSRATAVTQPTQDSSIVSQLELLESLRGRELLSNKEYLERRARILSSAFPARTKPAAAPSTTAAKSIDIEKYGRYKALVIGNNRYKKFQSLRTPVADAQAISQLLSSRYGFDVTTLIDANRYEIARALSQLRQNSKPSDNVLIYYAGHGYLDETTKRGYWLPVDAEPDNFANWISTSDVTDTLAGISARHALVVADSCFSGSLVRAASAHLDEREAQIERLLGKRSRTVMTSGGLEPVLDSGRGPDGRKHSIFARAFLEALRNNGDVLEVSRLFVDLRDQVTSSAEQTPQFAPIRNAGHDGGEFIFVPRRNP